MRTVISSVLVVLLAYGAATAPALADMPGYAKGGVAPPGSTPMIVFRPTNSGIDVAGKRVFAKTESLGLILDDTLDFFRTESLLPDGSSLLFGVKNELVAEHKQMNHQKYDGKTVYELELLALPAVSGSTDVRHCWSVDYPSNPNFMIFPGSATDVYSSALKVITAVDGSIVVRTNLPVCE